MRVYGFTILVGRAVIPQDVPKVIPFLVSGIADDVTTDPYGLVAQSSCHDRCRQRLVKWKALAGARWADSGLRVVHPVEVGDQVRSCRLPVQLLSR